MDDQIKITWGQRKVSNPSVCVSTLDWRQLIKESPQDTATAKNHRPAPRLPPVVVFGQQKVKKKEPFTPNMF